MRSLINTVIARNPVMTDPFNPPERTHQHGDFSRMETRLAHRNHGLLLELLQHDVTPVGAHYLLTHFDVPYIAPSDAWTLQCDGLVDRPRTFSMAELMARPYEEEVVTLECAGNGRALVEPRWQSQPWHEEAVGTARWGGTRLAPLLAELGVADAVEDVVFESCDWGIDGGVEHVFARSMTREQIQTTGALLVWQMNGQPLLPQHGFPLRVVVPGWYGMASVKWLARISCIDTPFQGYQQVQTYRYRQAAGDEGIPVQQLKVRSLMAPPGIPDWYSRERVARAGPVEVVGRAWSGRGVPIERVEVAVDGEWSDADVQPAIGRYAWSKWQWSWQASPGHVELMCRATDAEGQQQPIEPAWDAAGFGNNACQRVSVWVRE
ncbi:MAG: sulfite oxidase [Pseudomonadota bacterium]